MCLWVCGWCQRELEDLEKRTSERLSCRDEALEDADRERVTLYGLVTDVDEELNGIVMKIKDTAERLQVREHECESRACVA